MHLPYAFLVVLLVALSLVDGAKSSSVVVRKDDTTKVQVSFANNRPSSARRGCFLTLEEQH